MVVNKDNLATITQGETEREDGREKKNAICDTNYAIKKKIKKSFFFPQPPK